MCTSTKQVYTCSSIRFPLLQTHVRVVFLSVTVTSEREEKAQREIPEKKTEDVDLTEVVLVTLMHLMKTSVSGCENEAPKSYSRNVVSSY